MGAGWSPRGMRHHKTHTSPERERLCCIPGPRGTIDQAVFSDASTSSAAAIVAAMSASVCMLEKKSASY